MRKFLGVLLAVSFLVILGFGSKASASPVAEKSIEESYRDAVNNKSDVPLEEFDVSANLFKVEAKSNKKESLKYKEYKTAQIISENQKNGQKEEVIAVTVFQDVYLDEVDSNFSGNPVARLAADKGDSALDGSLGVRAYSRFYYTKTQTDRGVFGKVTKATGGWTRRDASINLSKRSVTIGSSGWTAGTQAVTKKPTRDTFSYNTPKSWKNVSLASGSHNLGVYTVVTLTRGGKPWKLELFNRL